MRTLPLALAIAVSACAGVTRMTVDDVGSSDPPAISGGDGDAGEAPGAIDGGSDAAASVVPIVDDSGADGSPDVDAGGGRDAGATNASPFVGTWSCAAGEYYAPDGGSGLVPGVIVLFAATDDGTLLQTLETPGDGGEVRRCSLACVVSGSMAAAIAGQSCSVWDDGVALGALTSETFTASGTTAIQSTTFAMPLSDGGSESAIYSSSCTRN
jgi:hypothetical protein